MDMQTVLLIFIAIFSLAIGFFLGLFLISVDAPFLKKLSQKEEPEETDENGEPQLTPTAEEKGAIVNKPSPNSELMLKVWKEEGKAPVYEVDGNYLEKEALPKEILNVITVHQELPQEPTPVLAPVPTPSEEEPTPDVIQETEDSDDGEIKMLSVIEEVNEILQRKLHGSSLAGKGIHLMENHNKEIRFWVGLESYDDVEDIPDPEIRKLIDEAVKEWEQSRE